jgi:hypothetical protein
VKTKTTVSKQTKTIHRVELTLEEVEGILIAHALTVGWIPRGSAIREVEWENSGDAYLRGADIVATHEERSEE